MKSLGRSLVLASLICAVATAAAQAHFVWIETAPQEGGTLLVRSGFGEGGGWDPDLGDKIKHTRYWVQDAAGATRSLDLSWDKREGEYRATVSGPAPRAIFGACDYGVVAFGQGKPFYLQYCAKSLTGAPDAWADDQPSKQLRIELLAKRSADGVRLTALWHGKPLAKATIKCETPDAKRVEIVTDDQGTATLPESGPGTYFCYVGATANEAGEKDGKSFETKKDYATLAFALPK